MASVNPLTKEILLKVVYYGPGLGGKTTTLQYIHRTAQPEHRGKMVSLATPVDRTLYFDFLPVRLPKIGNYTLRLQLFTVPGQVHYNATRKLVLNGADGVVLVADSQTSRIDANIESLDNLRDNLQEQKIDLDSHPFSIQYNKRDLKNICTIQELDRIINPNGRTSIGTCALSGEGVYQGLELITKEVLRDLKQREVITHDERSTADRIESQIAFKKEKQGILSTVAQYSEGSSGSISGKQDDEMTATYPNMAEHMNSMIEREVKRSETRSSRVEEDLSDFEDPSVKQPVSKGELPRPGTLGRRFPQEERVPDLPRPTVTAPPAKPEEREVARRTPVEPVRKSISFSQFWPPEDRNRIVEIEQAIADDRFDDAVAAIWSELERLITYAKQGLPGNTHESVIALLGLDGRQYLEVARIFHTSSAGGPVRKESLLRAYLFLLRTVNAI